MVSPRRQSPRLHRAPDGVTSRYFSSEGTPTKLPAKRGIIDYSALKKSSSPSNKRSNKEETRPPVTPSPPKKPRGAAKSTTTAKAIPKKKTATSPKKKKAKSPKKVPPAPGSKPPPPEWQAIYSLVQELRQDKSAPVDQAGAEVLPEKACGPKVFRFQVLMALMLSSQTKDAVVGEAMRKLQQHGLTVENIAHNTSPEQLNQLIAKVGFHNNKTKYIQAACQILLDQYNGDIPPTAKEMMDDLPGVGPKMAFLVETIAWGTTSGIGVDTHMHRMFNQLRWVQTKTPEQTRVELEAWLPRDKWSEVNYLWVGFGQEAQQQKPKMLRKALDCSRPLEALQLLQTVGLNSLKEGIKAGCEEEVKRVLGRK